MSQENLEVVVCASRAVTGQNPDYDTVNALYHPEHVFVPLGTSKLGEAAVVGAGGYQAWLSEDVMPVEINFEGAVDVGPDTVLSVATVRGRGATSGIDTEQRLWAVVTVTAKQITRTVIYADPAEALEAIGRAE